MLGSRIIERRREHVFWALISALNQIHISEKAVSEPVKLTVAIWKGWRYAKIIIRLEVPCKWLPFFVEKVLLRSLELDSYIRSEIPILHSVRIVMHVCNAILTCLRMSGLPWHRFWPDDHQRRPRKSKLRCADRRLYQDRILWVPHTTSVFEASEIDPEQSQPEAWQEIRVD